MNLTELPRAIVGGVLRVMRLPLDVVFDRGRDAAPGADERRPPAQPRPDAAEQERDRKQQAQELRDAVRPRENENEAGDLKDATDRAQEERKRSSRTG